MGLTSGIGGMKSVVAKLVQNPSTSLARKKRMVTEPEVDSALSEPLLALKHEPVRSLP